MQLSNDVPMAEPSAAASSGPILPINAEFAAAVRAAHRKEVDALQVGEHLDISLPDDLEFAEEGMDGDDAELRFTEDGTLIEPFNLWAERSAGYFDNEENYVARVNKDDTDAWLQALEDSEGVIKAGQDPSTRRAKQMHRIANEDKPEMKSTDRAEYKQKIVQRLRAGETVLEALKRLGTQDRRPDNVGGSKAERLELLRAKLAGTVPAENRVAFNTLTEAAGELLSAGDANVYSRSKEALVMDIKRDMRAALGGPASPRSNNQSRGRTNLQPGGGLQEAEAASSAIPRLDGADLARDSATMKEPLDVGAVEMDFEQRAPPGLEDNLRNDDAQGSHPQEPTTPNKKRKTNQGTGLQESLGTSTAKTQPSSQAAPPDKADDLNGFVVDTTTGLYYNSELGCYYDACSKLYRDANTGQWYKFSNGSYQAVES